MTAHAHLLDSDSFGGGFNVASRVTAANADGVTRNKSVTITAGNGETRVTMNKNGTYSIDGQTLALKGGQSDNLGNGERVTRNANDSLTIGERSGSGSATLDVTLAAHAGGVNVSATGRDVELGGYLVTAKHRAKQ